MGSALIIIGTRLSTDESKTLIADLATNMEHNTILFVNPHRKPPFEVVNGIKVEWLKLTFDEFALAWSLIEHS